MRKILLTILTAAATFISFSCEDDFSPKTTYKDQYVLYCIINATGSVNTQVATLYKSYNVDGYDPYTNKIDPAIVGADIKLYYKNVVYTFKDTTMERTDTSRYTTPKAFYAVNGIKFKAGDSVKIVATLKNGVVLSSAIKIPPSFSFKVNSYIIDPTEPTKDGNFWSVGWDSSDKTLLFSPKLLINYYKTENGKSVGHSIEVPMRYVSQKYVWTPYYPPISKTMSVSFDYNAIDSAMTQLSAGYSAKNDFKISFATFKLISLEENLASYYSISNGYMDDVSIRLDEGEYSNIQGGLGIFGAYYMSSTGYSFEESYVNSFGYVKVGY